MGIGGVGTRRLAVLFAGLDVAGLHVGRAAGDFGQSLGDLVAPAFVGGGGQLLLELGAREPQRLQGADGFWIRGAGAAFLAPLPLDLVLSLLNARFRVDQTFTGITHASRPPSSS